MKMYTILGECYPSFNYHLKSNWVLSFLQKGIPTERHSYRKWI